MLLLTGATESQKSIGSGEFSFCGSASWETEKREKIKDVGGER
jgi:hypothetical protein